MKSSSKKKRNAFYGQSGGVTPVINASAAGVLRAAKRYRNCIGKVYAGKNGILGALQEELIDTSENSSSLIKKLINTPGGAFGSCRFKLGSIEKNRREYERLIEVFQAHDIGYFFYNGGGDSQDTTHKVSLMSKEMNYPLTCIGIPKTIDNDLPYTDNSPGFGSVAKYVAVSIQEASLDLASMASSSTKVFILEVMGRHAGWIAAAAGLCFTPKDAPHIILFPEIPFQKEQFLKKVAATIKKYGFCSIVVSEGVRNTAGEFLSDSGLKDAFGHAQLGGVASVISNLIKQDLGYKCHYAIADYLQRSARHIASKTDIDQAFALGEAAVEMAVSGYDSIMPIIKRNSNKPYRWSVSYVPLECVANQEKHMPRNFINASGFGITEKCKEYLLPLIQGESYPVYKKGLPDYVELEKKLIPKKCKSFKV